MTKKLSFFQILVLLIGGVLGSFIAQLTAKVPFLTWLSFGETFGVSTFTLDLGIFSLTLGMSVTVTIATILGLIVGILVCRQMR